MKIPGLPDCRNSQILMDFHSIWVKMKLLKIVIKRYYWEVAQTPECRASFIEKIKVPALPNGQMLMDFHSIWVKLKLSKIVIKRYYWEVAQTPERRASCVEKSKWRKVNKTQLEEQRSLYQERNCQKRLFYKTKLWSTHLGASTQVRHHLESIIKSQSSNW